MVEFNEAVVRAVVDAVARGLPNPYPDGKAMCPQCGHLRPVIATAYGFRMPCEEPCSIRWTRIRGELDWVAETYSPLADNRSKDKEADAQD